MSRASQLKKKWNYERNAPRCDNCEHYKPGGRFLVNSLPRRYGAHCNLGAFNTSPTACCDKWAGKDGPALIVGVQA